MTFLKPLSILCFLGLSTGAQSQDIPDALVTILDEQGYKVTSTRYTWLGRIYVEATDGTNDRSILIARASGRILQDDMISAGRVHRPPNAAGDDDPDDERPTTDAPPRPKPDDKPPRDRPPPEPDDGSGDRHDNRAPTDKGTAL